jgi:cell division protein FtsA
MKQYVAALDIGTSKIVAMVAGKDEKGNLSLLAQARESSDNCIRRGCIYHSGQVADKVSGLIRRLNEQLKSQLHQPVEKIYVGIGGRSIYTKEHIIRKEIKDGKISPELLDGIKKEIEEYTPDFEEVLEILPPEYYLEGKLVSKPAGFTGSDSIEARFLLVVNRQSLKKNLTAAIQSKLGLGVSVAGYFISPLAAAEAVLTDKEKDLGCALVEVGAGLTYLSIYKGGKLRYLVTLPLGSSAITGDICSLNVPEKEAEELKIKYGSASITYGNDGKESAPEIASRTELKDFDFAVEARSDEIIANIKNQIEQSGYGSVLGSGIILTGGGVALKNFDISLKKKAELPVYKAKKERITFPEGMPNPQEYATVSGLLTLGKADCAKKAPVIKDPPPPEPGGTKGSNPPTPPTPPKPSFKERFTKKIGQFTSDLFPDA